MDLQEQRSRTIVDHRAVAKTSIAGVLGLIVGLLFGKVPARTEPDELVQVVSTAMDRGDDYWARLIPQYRVPRIVLFEGEEPTPCGTASAASGPFYCEQGERIYLDLGFLRPIKGRLGQMIVVGHELAHHCQKLIGQLKLLADNSVALELQADCLAGAWIKNESLQGHLADGDFQSAIDEIASVGDDRIDPSSSPESWTHGSSAMRVESLSKGFRGEPCL